MQPEPQPAVEVVSVNELRARLSDEIYEKTNGTVQDGPFKGMQMFPDTGWAETNKTAELLGFFEQELQPDIEREIRRLEKLPNPVVVNVGCAEGYYAIGIGRRLPHAKIMAFDIDARSLQILKKNAELNKVTLSNGSIEDAFACADLVVMDCEGAEYDYLDPDKHPGLKRATIIVEMHPHNARGPLEELLRARFSGTHSAAFFHEGPRDPNRSELLWRRSSFERWLAVCESRPILMGWAVMRPYPAIKKQCGDCGLCCKLGRIESLKKPKGEMCKHFDKGCTIYVDRPATCHNFNCLWLLDPNMPDDMRPDRIGTYAYGSIEDGYLKVATEIGNQDRRLVDYVTNTLKLHAIVEEGPKIEFVTADGEQTPTAIRLDWTLR